MKALQAWILSKKYTADTADSLGSLKGAPAEVVDVQYGEETTDVTLQWEGTSGQIQQLLVQIPNGEQGEQGEPGAAGRGITKCKVNAEEHLIITYDDGTTEDAGKITVSGGGGGGALEDDLTTSVTVGGIPSGTEYEEGTELETILRDMLNPTAYPTLTSPSASLSATGAKLLETGSTLNTTMTLTFNRGAITPAYGTSGYRAGAATGYKLDDSEYQQNNTFSVIITSAKTRYSGNVSYAEGEQPKDSIGQDYNSPLPAGNVNSNALTYEFVDAIWANTTNISVVAKLALVSKSAKVKEFSFPAQTVQDPEQFDIPASWTVTAVEVLNTLSNQWEDCSSEFSITDTTHDDASGSPVNYKHYEDNRGYPAGARKVRCRWS